MTVADHQRLRVYAMEYRELRGHRAQKLPMRTARKWVKAACRKYGVPQVTIRVYERRGCGGSYGDNQIQLDPTGGRNGLILAHELAHHFVAHLAWRAQDHGATFMHYYIALLHIWRIVPADGMRAICRKHKVRYSR